MALAPQLTNVGARGQDARYDISGLPQVRPGVYTDGVYEYDDRGLDLSGRPAERIAGLRGADEDFVDGQLSVAGGGGGGGGGGGMDAFYRQLQSLLMSQSAAERAGTRGAIQQALIGFGLVPEGFKDEFGALDDTTRALIQKNTDTGISGIARLNEAISDERKSDMARLASKGLRRSGAKGYKLRRLQLKKDRTQQDAIAALLGDIGAKYQGFAQNEGNRQMQLLNALFSSQYSFGGGGQRSAPTYSPISAPSGGGGGGGTPTYGGGQWIGGTGTAYGPAAGTSSGGYTSPLKPLTGFGDDTRY